MQYLHRLTAVMTAAAHGASKKRGGGGGGGLVLIIKVAEAWNFENVHIIHHRMLRHSNKLYSSGNRRRNLLSRRDPARCII